MDKFKHLFLQKIQSQDLSKKALIFERENGAEICLYEDLLNLVREKLELLKSIPQGSCVGILGDFDKDSVAFLLANLERQNIIAPFADESELNSKLNEGQIEFLFAKNELKKLKFHAKKHEIFTKLKGKNGLILFSSGSTGKPKAVVHDLDKFLSVYLNKKPKLINILLFLLFDHIGGLNTLFNTLSLNACGVASEQRKSVEFLAKIIQKHQIFMLPASPSLLNLMLLNQVQNKFNLNCLKFITYGTEKMPDSLLKRLKSAFPHAKFHQTFGASEVGITQTKTHENAIKLEMDYKIKNGELFLRSNTQALGYLNSDNSTFSEDGYFATGDLVELCEFDGEEYLRILGRTKELINVGGEKVLPQEIEGVILQIPFINDCLVYGENNAITGQSVCVKVVLNKEKLPLKSLNLSEKSASNLSQNSKNSSLNLSENSKPNLSENLNFNDENLSKLSNLELKKFIRTFCKDKVANFKIPTKVEICEDLAISERFKKIRKI